MMNLKSKKEEYELFSKLSNEWWDENGKFKILHQIKPIRMKYILSQFKENNVKNLDIIDLGCGGGLICEPLSRLGANVSGVDFVEQNIEAAKIHSKNKGLKINYLCKDIERINLSQKYDAIIIFEVLEHLDNWNKFLLKLKKNLKQNGKIIISTINRNIISKYSVVFAAENILKWIPKGTHDYNKFIKPEEILNFVKNNKMRMINTKGLVYNPIELSWNLSSIKKINYFCTIKNFN